MIHKFFEKIFDIEDLSFHLYLKNKRSLSSHININDKVFELRTFTSKDAPNHIFLIKDFDFNICMGFVIHMKKLKVILSFMSFYKFFDDRIKLLGYVCEGYTMPKEYSDFNSRLPYFMNIEIINHRGKLIHFFKDQISKGPHKIFKKFIEVDWEDLFELAKLGLI